MKQENEQQRAIEVDPQVSDQYESLATEKTPTHLDRAVLREATRAVRADNRKGSFGAWFRPVAFMAMVGLILAIILDLSDTSIFRPVAGISSEATPAVQAPPKSVVDSVDRNTSQPALNEIKRQEKLAPAPSRPDAPDGARDDAAGATPQAAASESRQADQGQLRKMRSEVAPAITPPPAAAPEDQARSSEAFTAGAESAERRVQEVESAVDANLQSRPGTAVQLAEPQGATAGDLLSTMAAPACSNEQKSDVDEWWRCIALLRQAGLTELADLEFENLRSSFPDFEPPE